MLHPYFVQGFAKLRVMMQELAELDRIGAEQQELFDRLQAVTEAHAFMAAAQQLADLRKDAHEARGGVARQRHWRH